MAIKKIAISSERKVKVQALNHPTDWDIYELPKQIKTASVKESESLKLGGFDLEGAIKAHPDHLYIKMFAIEKDEVNDNGDSFSEAELKKAAHTFTGVPLFTNHQNDDIEKAKGECVHSWYDDDDGGIFIIGRVDKIAYPRLARGIEEGYVKGCSMGAAVDFSCCSQCHNKAHVADEYCDHVKHRKNRVFSGTQECAFHDSSTKPMEDCPLCGKKHGASNVLTLSDQKVYEHNYGLKFIENSFVVNPACHRCGVCDILHVPSVTKKISDLQEQVAILSQKAASGQLAKAASSEKVAGADEINMLKDSMEKMEGVVKSMLKQKEQVSMEYVSDLVKAMADVQNIVDELAEMGYSQLPSPDIDASQSLAGPEMTTEGMPQQPASQVPQAPPMGGRQVDVSPSGIATETLGDLGSVTRPTFSSNFIDKKKEFLKTSSNVRKKVIDLTQSLQRLSENRSTPLANIITEIKESEPGNRSIRIEKIADDGETYVTEASGEKILKVSNVSEFPQDIQDLISSDPQKAGELLLNKESTNTMANDNPAQKSAAVGNPSSDSSTQGEVITEKQLASGTNVDLHPRTNETWEQITEAEVEGDKDATALNDTTSESPQTRRGTYETITEDQLDSISSGYVTRWKDAPEVITEKQWTDFSRLVSAKLPPDWLETITEDQLRNLLSNHTFVGPYEVITEGQLAGQDYGIKRWASANYNKAVVKVATEAVSDAIAKYSKSPQEIRKALAYATDSHNLSKVTWVTLANALPHKAEAINDLKANIAYFRKTAASADTPSALEAIILSAATHGTHGVKIEDAYEAMVHAMGSKKASAMISDKVQEKLAETSIDNSVIDKQAAFESAINELDRPGDGLYKVKATIEEIGADPKNKKAFVQAAHKFAQKQIGKQAETVMIELEVDFEAGTIDIVQKDSGMATEDDLGAMDSIVDELEGDAPDIADENGDIEEDKECMKPMTGGDVEQTNVSQMGTGVADGGGAGGVMTNAAKRSDLSKKAQMMGGQMGGQGGAGQGPGAGASLPTPPGAIDGVPPAETFTAGEPGDEGGFDEDLEARPPGSMCVVCGSDDVDIISGKGQCNNCGSEMQFKVSVDVTHWADLTPDKKGEGEGDEFGEGEGFELPEEGGMEGAGGMGDMGGGLPTGAMVRLAPGALEKIAKAGIKIGSVSPANGKTNTVSIGEGNHYCLDTGVTYKVAYAADLKKKSAQAQWEWTIKKAGSECPSCSREKAKIVKSLAAVGVTREMFDGFNMEKRAEAILKARSDGQLKLASSEDNDIVENYKQAYSTYGDAFPMEMCMQRLANRFGDNALALSGPCEGKPLADCVCNSLKKASLYSSGLAVKVGESWVDRDGTDCCVEDQIRKYKLNFKDATAVCSAFKMVMAAPEDLLAEKLAQLADITPLEDDIVDDDVDAFDNPEGDVSITLELDQDTAQKLDAELDSALGSDPTDDLGPGDESLVPEGDMLKETDPEGVDVGAEPVEEIAPMTDDPAAAGEAAMDAPAKAMTDDPAAATGVGEVKAMPEGVENSGMNEGIPGEGVEQGQSMHIETRASQEDEGYGMKEAMHMHGRVGHTGQISLDLSAVAEALNKSAGEKEISQENVQDGEGTKPYSAGNPADGGHSSDMFHEKETVPTATKPTVPRNEALMGHENDAENANPQDSPQPVVPSENATMGHEDETGLSGGDNRYTGGDDGAGKTNTASSEDEAVLAEVASMSGFGNPKDRLARLAERIIEAGEKKLEPKKPVSKDEDIKPVSDGGSMGHEPKFTADEPTNTETANNSHMGHEQESLGDKPTSPKDHPDIPADNALMGHEEGGEVGPEKQTRDKGTVIAQSDREPEARKESDALAFRVAGQMLQSGLIEASQLGMKVAELSKYEPAQIVDYQKMVQESINEGRKGLDTASGGLERPLVINEASSIRNGSDELQSKLASLFTLAKQNQEAIETPDFALRQVYK